MDGEYAKIDGSIKRVAYIVQEHIEGVDLVSYIKNVGDNGQGINLTEDQCRYFFKQLLSGMTYIHLRGISHRNLKPENFVLTDNYNCKITGFGHAKAQENGEKSLN